MKQAAEVVVHIADTFARLGFGFRLDGELLFFQQQKKSNQKNAALWSLARTKKRAGSRKFSGAAQPLIFIGISSLHFRVVQIRIPAN